MSGEYVDDVVERQLHSGFTAREDLLDDFDRLVLGDGTDRCVALLGGAGVGKTAIVTRWLARRETTHDLVFHHFIRRQQGDRAEPWLVARSLAMQIEKRFPHLRDPFARPEARLGELVSRVSARELMPGGLRMALVIDGIDERASGSDLREVLSCLPRAQPGGTRLVLAGRLLDPRRDLQGRCAEVVAIDLDDPGFADDNAATVRAFWRREGPALGLDDGFVEHAIHAAAGNMLHATMLRRHLASVPRSQHRPEALPRDLASLLAALWRRVDGDPAAVRALEILCAAREPLSLEQIGRVAGWSDPGDLRAVVNLARELVVETQRGDRTKVYGLFHDAVRGFLVERLGPTAIRGHHRELADKLATWPLPRDAATRRYALRHAVGHCIAAGDCRAIHALAGNVDFLEAKCSALGLDDTELDVRRAAEACLAVGQMALHRDLDRLVRSIARESSSLRRDAGVDSPQLWQRIRRDRDPADRAVSLAPGAAGDGVRADGRTGPLRERPAVRSAVIGHSPTALQDGPASSAARRRAPSAGPATALPGRPALVRALVGRGGAVTACAVAPDSRRLIAAYADHSLEVWDLEGGRLLRTMTGHAGAVRSCAVTPDGRWVVSASADATLKIWDLDTGDLLATFEGHTGPVESCAVTPDGRRVVSASADTTLRTWDLDTGDLLATFEDHTGSVQGCAITPDSRRVVSASADTTLKLWDLDTGDVLATFEGHTDQVRSCSVTPDGRHVVSGSADHTLKVWDAGTGRVTTTLRGHAGAVASCAVAPDSRSVYSASLDTTLKIWDVDTGRVVTTLEGHASSVTCCAVAPDGRRLISGSSDSTLNVWALDGHRTSTVAGIVKPPPISTRPLPARTSIAPRARGASGARQLILFLAAKDTNRRVLEKECAAIESELRIARHGADFEFCSKWALTVDDVARHLLDLDPTIVHFRGQGQRELAGSEPGASRTPGPHGDSGIYLQDERGGVQLVTGRALKMLVESSAPSARVVVLNACYSDGHAAELCQVVDCVVGMTRDHDHAAHAFAIAFYRALGHRKSVGDAVAHAVAMLALKQVPDECVPRCRTPNWIDPREISLTPDRATP